MNHRKVLLTLISKYGSREAIAFLLNISSTSIYFWEYRQKIPEQYHGKLIAIGVSPELLIKDYQQLIKSKESIEKLAR